MRGLRARSTDGSSVNAGRGEGRFADSPIRARDRNRRVFARRPSLATDRRGERTESRIAPTKKCTLRIICGHPSRGTRPPAASPRAGSAHLTPRASRGAGLRRREWFERAEKAPAPPPRRPAGSERALGRVARASRRFRGVPRGRRSKMASRHPTPLTASALRELDDRSPPAPLGSMLHHESWSSMPSSLDAMDATGTDQPPGPSPAASPSFAPGSEGPSRQAAHDSLDADERSSAACAYADHDGVGGAFVIYLPPKPRPPALSAPRPRPGARGRRGPRLRRPVGAPGLGAFGARESSGVRAHASPDGASVAFLVGDVDNADELRADLLSSSAASSAERSSSSSSAAALVARLHAEHGRVFLPRAEGFFAFALVDAGGGPGHHQDTTGSSRVFAATDRRGGYRLYKTKCPAGGVVIAHALKVSEARDALRRRFAGESSGGAERIPPGSYVRGNRYVAPRAYAAAEEMSFSYHHHLNGDRDGDHRGDRDWDRPSNDPTDSAAGAPRGGGGGGGGGERRGDPRVGTLSRRYSATELDMMRSFLGGLGGGGSGGAVVVEGSKPGGGGAESGAGADVSDTNARAPESRAGGTFRCVDGAGRERSRRGPWKAASYHANDGAFQWEKHPSPPVSSAFGRLGGGSGVSDASTTHTEGWGERDHPHADGVGGHHRYWREARASRASREGEGEGRSGGRRVGGVPSRGDEEPRVGGGRGEGRGGGG